MESNEVKVPSVKELPELFVALMTKIEGLEAKIAELEASKSTKSTASTREMTNDDARRVLTGDLKEKSHKDAATELGLSYGQVYSCRLDFTFKHIHKEMRDAGVKNRWIKA